MRAAKVGMRVFLLALLVGACDSPATGPGEEPDVPDTEAPRFNGVNNSRMVPGGIEISGQARDNVGVVKVVFRYDDTVREATFAGDTVVDFTFGPIVPVEGPHTVVFEAYDAKGNRAHHSATSTWRMPTPEVLPGPGSETGQGAFLIRGDTGRARITARSRYGLERFEYRTSFSGIVHVDVHGDTVSTLSLDLWMPPGHTGVDVFVYPRTGSREWVPFYFSRTGVRFRSVAPECGVANDDRVYCWSYQYGTGYLDLVPIPGGARPVAVSRGGSEVTEDSGCVLMDDGSYYCWQQFGGSGRRVYRVPGSAALKSISVANDVGCGLGAGNDAYCWMVYPNVTEPVAVPGGLRFRELSVGTGYVCGVTLDQRGYCWGANRDGQLGRGDTLASAAPAPVEGGLLLASIAAGPAHSCAVTTAGRAYCWGGTNALGQLGGSGPSNSARRVISPSLVTDGIDFSAVSTGIAHSCGLATDGRIFCWGDNQRNQLGTGGSPALSAAPVAIAGTERYRSLSTKGDLTCARTTDDRVLCWGEHLKTPSLPAGQ